MLVIWLQIKSLIIVVMDPFFHKCLDILKKEEVKDEIKTFMKPFIDMMLNELYPYIYLSTYLKGLWNFCGNLVITSFRSLYSSPTCFFV